MAGKFDTKGRAVLGTTETTILAELAAGAAKRVFMRITNIGTAAAQFTIQAYDPPETAATTGVQYYQDREIGPNSEEVIKDDDVVLGGWKITGSADVADVVIVHTVTFDYNA